MEKHEIKIAGESVSLAWDQETAKRYHFRMAEIGGEPTDYSNPNTIATNLFKVLYGLLPVQTFKKYSDPEDLWVAVDHENEGEAIFKAINAVFLERFPDAEKKSNGRTKRSQESS